MLFLARFTSSHDPHLLTRSHWLGQLAEHYNATWNWSAHSAKSIARSWRSMDFCRYVFSKPCFLFQLEVAHLYFRTWTSVPRASIIRNIFARVGEKEPCSASSLPLLLQEIDDYRAQLQGAGGPSCSKKGLNERMRNRSTRARQTQLIFLFSTHSKFPAS